MISPWLGLRGRTRIKTIMTNSTHVQRSLRDKGGEEAFKDLINGHVWLVLKGI
jgi:hypothetical protein